MRQVLPERCLRAVVDVVTVVAAMGLVWSWTASVSYGLILLLLLLLLVGVRPAERINLGVAHDIPILTVRGLIAFAVCAALSVFVPDASIGASLGAIGVPIASTLGMLTVSRAGYYYGLRKARRRGHFHARTLVVGDGDVAGELVRAMCEEPGYGLRVVGTLGQELANAPRSLLLGPVDVLERVLSEQPVDKIVVAFGSTPDADLLPLLRRLAYQSRASVYIVPRFFELGLDWRRSGLDFVSGIPLQRLLPPAPRRSGWPVKRPLDVLVASTLLLLLAPFLAAIALVLTLSSPGPVLFRQRRVGQGGREFDLVKFRTLRVASPEAAQGPVDQEAPQLIQARQRRDVEERQTLIGRILRVTSADELPQLWNVLRGDMSLVGPRPEVPQYVRVFNDAVPGYRERHRLPVGLTGWAQVHGLRGDTSIAKRVRFDNNYIEHWSLWRDCAFICATLRAVLSHAIRDLRVSTSSARLTVANSRQGLSAVRVPWVGPPRATNRSSDLSLGTGGRSCDMRGRKVDGQRRRTT